MTINTHENRGVGQKSRFFDGKKKIVGGKIWISPGWGGGKIWISPDRVLGRGGGNKKLRIFPLVL